MKESEQDFIRTLSSITGENLANEDFGPEELSKKAGISHSSLHRRLKSSLNLSGSQFIRNIRLDKARELLLEDKLTVSEIAYRVGFGSPTYFIRCFHNYFGTPPGEYKLKPREENSTPPHVADNRKRKTNHVLTGIFASVIVLAGLIFLLKPIFGWINPDSRTEKSLAMLPVKYIGETDEQYMADGTMQEIMNHLMKIHDLRVAPRTSVEQYRNNSKTIRKIGSEQNVSYILESSFQKNKDEVQISCFLYRANDEKLLWNNKYEKEWADILNVQIEVAQDIANELKAVISPEEKRKMEKTITYNLSAYDFYQRGMEEMGRYENIYNWEGKVEEGMKALNYAAKMFRKAVDVDPSFALAYLGQARIYSTMNYWKTYFTGNFLDSVLILANKALEYDKELAEAYYLKGYYHNENGETKNAIKDYTRAIELNANLWRAYFNLGTLYLSLDDNAARAISNYNLAALHYNGPALPVILRRKALAFQWAGQMEQAETCLIRALELDNDSVNFYISLSYSESCLGNFLNAIRILEKAIRIDPGNLDVLGHLGYNSMLSGDYKKSWSCYKIMVEKLKQRGAMGINTFHRIGFASWQNGFKEEAERYFKEQKKYNDGIIRLGRVGFQNKCVFFDVAAICAFEGEKGRAIENLKIFNQKERMPSWGLALLKYDPMLDNIRGEIAFQQIVMEAEAKFLAEQERVKKWLEEKGMN